MPNVDRFESVFKAASKAVFAYEPVSVRSVDVVCDLGEAGAVQLTERVRGFLRVLDGDVVWRAVGGERCRTVEQLLGLVQEDTPELMVTYRNLHAPSRWPYTLGPHLDVLTQATDVPVLVIPHPDDAEALTRALENTDRVMAVTDHLAGDSALVSAAAGFTVPGGTLFLTHVEDDAMFNRYIETIAKIPEIDTDTARQEILKQLLKEPTEYIESCAKGLAEAGLGLRTEAVVVSGHRIGQYKRLIEEHAVDLLVMNTKDRDQLAMHGMAYPLAVELRETPVLML